MIADFLCLTFGHPIGEMFVGPAGTLEEVCERCGLVIVWSVEPADSEELREYLRSQYPDQFEEGG